LIGYVFRRGASGVRTLKKQNNNDRGSDADCLLLSQTILFSLEPFTSRAFAEYYRKILSSSFEVNLIN